MPRPPGRWLVGVTAQAVTLHLACGVPVAADVRLELDVLLGHGSEPIDIDLRDVTGLDVPTIGIFVRARRRAQELGRQLALVNLSSAASEAITEVGLSDFLVRREPW